MARRGINEQALFEAALNEFSTHSYDEASVNRIIAAAGIPKGSFYYRYKTKYDLYLSLLKEGHRRKWEYIHNETGEEPASVGESDLFDFFLLQAESGVRFAEAFPELHQLGRMFSKEKGTPLYTQVIVELGVGDESGLEKMIEEALASGVFKEGYSGEFLKKLLPSLFSSFDEIFFKNETMELDRALSYLEEFVRFMKYGVKAVQNRSRE